MNGVTMPRGTPRWDDTWMELAILISSRSKDPHTQIGAVIVEPRNQLIGIGYNGPPHIISDLQVDWTRPAKYDFVIHAEENAIYNAIENVGIARLRDARMYISGSICSRCVLRAAKVEIREIVTGERMPICVDEEDRVKTMNIIALAGMTLTRYSPHGF